MFANHLAPILFQMHFADLGDIHRDILLGMGVLKFQWGIGIPMGSIIFEAIGFPLPHGISQGVGFPMGYGNPMGYWNSNYPIGIPRRDLIATQRSGEGGRWKYQIKYK